LGRLIEAGLDPAAESGVGRRWGTGTVSSPPIRRPIEPYSRSRHTLAQIASFVSLRQRCPRGQLPATPSKVVISHCGERRTRRETLPARLPPRSPRSPRHLHSHGLWTGNAPRCSKRPVFKFIYVHSRFRLNLGPGFHAFLPKGHLRFLGDAPVLGPWPAILAWFLPAGRLLPGSRIG